MVYLIHLGLALLAQVLWEELGFESTPRLWLVLAFCLVPHALGTLAHRLYLRGRFALADRAFLALHWSPVLLYAGAVFAAGWLEILGGWTGVVPGLTGWPSPLSLLSFAPFVVYTLIAIDARSRVGAGSQKRWLASLRFQGRMFAAALVPLIAYALISWAVGAIGSLRLNIETVALWNAVYAGMMLVLFAAGIPWLLRNTWETEPLPAGAERALLDAVSERAGFDGRRLFLWHTNFSAANAAIIGLFPIQRVVLFSDLLLSQLDLRQLASVYAHEIGHAKRKHVLIFAAWAFAALFGADLLAREFIPDDAGWTTAVLAGSTVIWAVGFGWMSRRFELEADLYSLRLIGEAAPLIQALQQVSGPHGQSKTSWRHFSTERRIAFLEAAVRDPKIGERLERRLWWVSRAGFLAFLVVMTFEGLGLLHQWPRDQVLLDLRRGDYAAAVERIDRSPGDDAQLASLVRRAATLRQGDAAELERQARAALLTGDLDAAEEWLDLGAMRGEKDMEQVQAVLLAAQETPRPDTRKLLDQTPDSWRAVLEQALRSVLR